MWHYMPRFRVLAFDRCKLALALHGTLPNLSGGQVPGDEVEILLLDTSSHQSEGMGSLLS